MSKLLIIPDGLSLYDYVNLPKTRPSATESFSLAMEYPMEMARQRCRNLELDGKKMKVIPFVEEKYCRIIIDALKRFEPCFDFNFRSKSQLKKMPSISEFWNCPKHCRLTDYSVEFKLCTDLSCKLCKKFGRLSCTPNVKVKNCDLCDKVLRFMTLSVPNKDDL